MSFVIQNWYLILAALVSGGMLVWPLIVSGSQGAAVGTAGAVQLINREKGVVIDVSEPAEFAAGHVVGARNAPLASLEGSKELPSNKTLPLIVVCATGARASKAVAKLTERGHTRVHVLRGGMGGWRGAELPVEKSA